MTRHAASCWYSAWLSSWRLVCSAWRSACVSSMSASHSSWNSPSRPGMLVAGVARGLTVLLVASGSRSSRERSHCVTGHLPVSCTYFSISRFSNTWPDFLQTTGSSGTLPLMAQNMVAAAAAAARCCC